MDSLIIPDGYTCTATIEAVPGVHPKVAIVYRPPTALTRVGFSAARDDMALVNIVAKQVLTWTVDGQSVKLDAAQVSKISGPLFSKVSDYVFGFAGPTTKIEDAEKN